MGVYICLGGESRGKSLDKASYEDIRFLTLHVIFPKIFKNVKIGSHK